jgi:glycopeptide antibiotics resistance protein
LGQQLLSLTSWRVVDIEDVIAQVIGATFGFWVYSSYQKRKAFSEAREARGEARGRSFCFHNIYF